ncbi:MAG: hypothetical protein OEY22_08090 [Candidatus Bathyarchaeota archaeon]|nr:hypothetical protein [Candidatus Bathyarchaeota archaeon]MDH5788573.1 hypothetical protein [Candidatus Bathyarchaeota archaeon]
MGGGRDRGIGADYDIVFAYSVAGSKYPTGAWLQFWNSSTNSYQGWESLDLAGFTDGVEINIPLNFIQNPEAVDIIVYSQCETFDRIDQAFSYSNNQNSIIVVDGAPSDWDSMTPAIVDPAGDVDPPDFDFTRFYTTNDQYRIFHRFDVSGILNLSIPGSVDNPRRAFYYIYYDIDNNASTGCPSTWSGGEGEGAEYRLWIGLYDSYYSMLGKWDGNNWIQAFDWAEAMKEIPVKFDAVVEVAVPLSAINATLGNTIRIFVGGIHGFSAIVDDFLPDEGVITLERAMIPWPLGTVLWMLGAVLAVGGMGFATLAGESARTLRRILMTAIIFELSFTIYYPIAQLPANARDPLRDFFYLEFATVLLVTFLFSALEKGLGWPFIFGNSLTWGLVFGYNFFFGYPYWLMVLYLIGEGLLFGFLYVFLGAVGQSFIGWIRNRKTSAGLSAAVLTRPTQPRIHVIQWPTIQDYVAAFQNVHIHLTDPELKRGNVEADKIGLPRSISGNFACVFKIRSGNGVYAVRCFYNSKIIDLQTRYKSISNCIGKVRLPCFVNFEYIQDGISIGNRKYPILKMEWAKGEILNKFISKNLGNKNLLEMVAEKFVESVIEMQKCGVAHGDLQHGNIKVSVDQQTNSVNVYFVDYDGLFVRDFQGSKSPELGHSNYQHPRRTENHYDERLDNFSTLVVYLSILAIAEDPALWKRYHDEEYIIFTRIDFENPRRSNLVQKLLRSSSSRIKRLTELLVEALNCDPLSDKTRPDYFMRL